jgi:hypothetical protein
MTPSKAKAWLRNRASLATESPQFGHFAVTIARDGCAKTTHASKSGKL